MGLPRSAGWVVLAIGVIVLIVTVFASDLGLGGAQYGTKHILGLVIGIVVAVAGLYLALRPEPAKAK